MIRLAPHPSRSQLAIPARLSRSALYYHPKQPNKDWQTKCLIEEVLHEHPSYGHKRIAIALKLNKKRIRRVMKIFGIKPYRRRSKKPWKQGKPDNCSYPNLLLTNCPDYENHIWVSDFTYIPFKNRFVYLATVMDLYTKKIVGLAVLTNHSSQLVTNALLSALLNSPRPLIFHSDNGSE